MAQSKWSRNYPNFARILENSGYKIAFIAKAAGLTYRQLYGRLTKRRK